MGCCHQINIGSTLLLQPEEDIGKMGYRDLATEIFMTQLIILTKDTFQCASGKENRTASGFSADTGLLPEMEGSSGDFRQSTGLAVSPGFCTVNAAASGTKSTGMIVHHETYLQYKMKAGCEGWPAPEAPGRICRLKESRIPGTASGAAAVFSSGNTRDLGLCPHKETRMTCGQRSVSEVFPGIK